MRRRCHNVEEEMNCGFLSLRLGENMFYGIVNRIDIMKFVGIRHNPTFIIGIHFFMHNFWCYSHKVVLSGNTLEQKLIMIFFIECLTIS